MSESPKPTSSAQGPASLKPSQGQAERQWRQLVSSASPQQRKSKAPTHKAVIVLLVKSTDAESKASYDAVQHLRSQHDDAFARWLPHVTLVPPFDLPLARLPSTSSTAVPDASQSISSYNATDLVASSCNAIKKKLRDKLSQLQPFQLKFTDHGKFQLKAYTNYHLRPAATSSSSGHAELRSLHATITTALAELVTPARRPFKPHLTIGQASSKQDMELVGSSVKVLSERDEPLSLRVESVALLGKRREFNGAYRVWEVLPLGSRR